MICIVPARAGSSLKDKNLRRFGEDSRPLLARALEKCISVFGKNRVIALVDSARLAECAQSAGAFAVLDEAVPAHEDVSARLWRLAAADFMRIHAGTQIALVQCTSPHTSEETLERFAALAPKLGADDVAISAVRVRDKATAFFTGAVPAAAAEDAAEPQQPTTPRPELPPPARALFADAPPSAPRQTLPQLWRFTGAVTLFLAARLSPNASLFHGAKIRLVETPIAEALDIDREEDFTAKEI